MWFVLNLFRESKGWCHPRKIWLFWLSFTLGKNIFSTQTDTKFLYNYKNNLFYCNLRTINVIFFLKTGNLILNWVLLSFSYNDIMPETLLSHSILPNSLVKKGTIWNYNLAYDKKNNSSSFFFCIGKNWEIQPEQQSSLKLRRVVYINKRLPTFQTQWMRYFITSSFINLSMSWEKYVLFSIEKNYILKPSWTGNV